MTTIDAKPCDGCETVRRREPIAISAISLLEIAVLFSQTQAHSDISVYELVGQLESDPAFQIMLLTVVSRRKSPQSERPCAILLIGPLSVQHGSENFDF